MTLTLSPLGHTWILDLDGTLVEHNGYKKYGRDRLLSGVKEFFEQIPEKDYVLILTARTEEYRGLTERFLRENRIRYDQILYGMPAGERILVNDRKPSGLEMAVAVSIERNSGFQTVKMMSNPAL